MVACLCRRCHGLVYASQREQWFAQDVRKSVAIRKRLGGEPSISALFPRKPNLRNFVRLTDKSILSYERVREALETFAARKGNEGPELLFFLRATSDMETSLSALDRAARIARSLRRRAPKLQIQKAELLTPAEVDRVRNMRNGFEHTEQMMIDGRIPEAANMMVKFWPEGIEFMDDEISFELLAEWLLKIHSLCVRLTDMDPTTS